MFEQSEKELEKALELAFEAREEKGLENPENVSISAYWSRQEGKTVDFNRRERRIGYNIFMVFKDCLRHMEDGELNQKARQALADDMDRDRVASKILERWRGKYEQYPSDSISVSAIFHSLETAVFRDLVPESENRFVERFATDAVGSFVRDQLFRDIDSVTSETMMARKFVTHLRTHLSRETGMVEPDTYELCYEIVKSLQEMDAREIHESYSDWDSIKDIVS